MMRKQHIPNLLTGFRVLAVPAALTLMIVNAAPHWLLALFATASVTDFFDGYLARKWQAVSPLGTMLDPIADKLLVALLLLYLAFIAQVGLVPIALILLREIYISGLREFLALRGVALPVSQGGKLKTAVQMLAIVLIYAAAALENEPLWTAGMGLLWAAAAIAVATGVQYTRAAWPNLLH